MAITEKNLGVWKESIAAKSEKMNRVISSHGWRKKKISNYNDLDAVARGIAQAAGVKWD